MTARSIEFSMSVCARGVFGPVIAVTRYDSCDEALRLANDTRYGLQASVFARDIAKVLFDVRNLDFGGVLVNEVPTWRADQQPYEASETRATQAKVQRGASREMTEERLVVLCG